MSNFQFQAKVKTTGEVKDVSALDDYFGRHQYGYSVDGKVLKEDEFCAIFEEEQVEYPLPKTMNKPTPPQEKNLGYITIEHKTGCIGSIACQCYKKKPQEKRVIEVNLESFIDHTPKLEWKDKDSQPYYKRCADCDSDFSCFFRHATPEQKEGIILFAAKEGWKEQIKEVGHPPECSEDSQPEWVGQILFLATDAGPGDKDKIIEIVRELLLSRDMKLREAANKLVERMPCTCDALGREGFVHDEWCQKRQRREIAKEVLALLDNPSSV